LEEDFNIFADVDEYGGIDLGADDEAEDEAEAKSPSPSRPERRDTSPKPSLAVQSRGWFVTEGSEEEQPSDTSKHLVKPTSPHTSKPETRPSPRGRRRSSEAMEHSEKREIDEAEEEKPARLQPLESSALPSIRDFLAMDEAAEAAEKRRKRKEKKKQGGGGGGGASGKSIEEKVNRDFQRHV
jgi:IK cytokine